MRFFFYKLLLLISTTLPAVGYSNILQGQCEPNIQSTKKITPITQKDDAYLNLPYNAGETAVYKVSYMGVFVGYGHMFVQEPVKYKGNWQRVFLGQANTGKWYRALFEASDRIMAYNRAEDGAITKFYIKQDEGKIFTKRFKQQKWLEFDHSNCEVHEIIAREGKPIKRENSVLSPGAKDTLGVVYHLRELKYEVGKPQNVLVFSSQKNWWLEATPLATEEVTVPSGKYLSDRLKLQTYIGKELQQKGDVTIWIARDHPNRPLVKIEGEIKIGSVKIELDKFTPGGKSEVPEIKKNELKDN